MTRAEKHLWLRGVTSGFTFAGFCLALLHHHSFWWVVFWTLSGAWQLYGYLFPKETPP